MADREKVLKGMETLRDVCNAKADMAIGEGRTAWAGYASVVHLALALLREQETVEPVDLGLSTDFIIWGCPICDRWLDHDYKYCPYCGRKVKWDAAN